jgi:F-type H+-transporting ATPase subunit delta
MSQSYARPYAEALLGTVPAGFDIEGLIASLRDVSSALASSAPLRAVLSSPAVKLEEKSRIVEALRAKAGAEAMAGRYLRLLLENGRILQLSEILGALRTALDAREGVVPAHVTAASELDGASRERVSAALAQATGRKIRASFTTDPSLLAGFVARVGSKIYDASALGAIEKFKEEAHGN